MIDCNKKSYKRHFTPHPQWAISAALGLLLLLLALAPSPALCLSARASDSRWQLPQNQKGKRDCYQRTQSRKLIDLLCRCWQGHILDQRQNWVMRASLSSPGLGKQSALFPCAAFAAGKEPGSFWNDRIDTSVNHQHEQSVTLQPMHNLEHHDTAGNSSSVIHPPPDVHSELGRTCSTGSLAAGIKPLHSRESPIQKLGQNYFLYVSYPLKFHWKLRFPIKILWRGGTSIFAQVLALSFACLRGVDHKPQAESQYLCFSIIQIQRGFA